LFQPCAVYEGHRTFPIWPLETCNTKKPSTNTVLLTSSSAAIKGVAFPWICNGQGKAERQAAFRAQNAVLERAPCFHFQACLETLKSWTEQSKLSAIKPRHLCISNMLFSHTLALINDSITQMPCHVLSNPVALCDEHEISDLRSFKKPQDTCQAWSVCNQS